MNKIEYGKKYRHKLFPEISGIATARCGYWRDATTVCLEYIKDLEIREVWVNEIDLEDAE